MNPLDRRSYFFDDGLRFGCQGCGDCCTGAPGVVRASPKEADDIAVYLGMTLSRTIGEFLSPREIGYRIREDGQGRCLFFESGCRIYPVRPNQCRTFPFWFSNLRSEARWESIRRQCQGIGKGRHYTKNEILDILQRSMQKTAGQPLA